MILTLLSSTLEVWEEILVPVCICVVLPCVIVYLVMQATKHDIDRRSEVALKAIEKGLPIDPCFLSKGEKHTSVKRKVFANLTSGVLLLCLGAEFSTETSEAVSVPDSASAEDKFRYQELYQAIGDLSPNEKASVLLFYMEDRSIKEISAIMSIPEGTVKSLLSRGRVKLKEKLEVS